MQRAAARLTKNCTVHFKTQPRKTMARLKNSHVCRRRRCWSLKWEEMHRGEGDRGRLAHYLPHYSHAPIILVCRRTTFLHSRVQSALHMHEGRNSPPPPLFIIQTPRFPSVLAKSNNGILKQMHMRLIKVKYVKMKRSQQRQVEDARIEMWISLHAVN